MNLRLSHTGPAGLPHAVNFNRSCNSFTKSFNDKADKDPEVRDEEADEDLVEEAVLGSQSKSGLWDPLM